MAFGGWYSGKIPRQPYQPSVRVGNRFELDREGEKNTRPNQRHARVADSTINFATRTDEVDSNITGARPKTFPRRERDFHDPTINRGCYEHRRPITRDDSTQGRGDVLPAVKESTEPTRKRYPHRQTSQQFEFRGGSGRFHNRGRPTSYESEEQGRTDSERAPLVHQRSTVVRPDGDCGTKTRNAPDYHAETRPQSISPAVATGSQNVGNRNTPTCDTSAISSADGNISESLQKTHNTVKGSVPEPYRVKPQTKATPFSEKQLQKFLEGNPSVVLSQLVERKDECMAILNQNQISNSTLKLILKVLSMLCSLDPVSAHIKDLNVVLTMVESSLFLSKHLTRFLVCLPIEEPCEVDCKNDNDVHELGMVVKLLQLFLQHKPRGYSEVSGALILLEKVLTSECFVEDLQQLKISYSAVEQAKRSAKERASEKPPPNNFRDIPIFPQSIEIRQVARPFLRKNIIKGRYDNVEHYLDVQFRLLREDFVAPLREGVTEFLSDTGSRPQDIRIYTKVFVHNRTMGSDSLVHTLTFDTKPFKRMNWESSKRLLYGNFVCLTQDKFQHIICATVENREVKDLEHGRVGVRFINETRDLSEGPYTMAESAAYFEACRHVLHGLQQINERNFPFKKYIVDVASTVDTPAYLCCSLPSFQFRKNPRVDDSITYDLSILDKKLRKIPVLEIENWPSAEDLHLDESQKAALQTALTKDFAIIQGPPGTGKTYIGLKIVQLLLHNVSPPTGNKGMRYRGGAPPRSPILVVCYTNHALDQFLEGIYHFDERQIIRVGSRSKSEILKDRSLSHIRQIKRVERRNRRDLANVRELANVRKLLQEGDENIRRILLKIELPTKVLLNIKALQEYMTSTEFRALLIKYQQGKEPVEDPQKLLNWLGVIEKRKDENFEVKIFNENAAYNRRCIKRCGRNQDVEPVEELQKPDVMTEEEANSVERVWLLNIPDRWRLYRLWVERYLADHNVEFQRQRQIQDDLSEQLQALGVFQDRGQRGGKDARELEMHRQATAENIQCLVLKIELPTKVLLNVWALRASMSRSEYRALLMQHQGCQKPQEDPQKLLNWLDVFEANEHIQVEDEGRRIQMERQVDDMDEDGIALQEERQQFIKQQTYHKNAAYDPACLKRCGKSHDVEPVVELQKPDVMTPKEAECVERVWYLNKWDRWRLYRLWVKRYLEDHEAKLQKQRQEYTGNLKRLQSMKEDEDLEILQEAKVIGMTTTGAAKCRAVLQRLGPAVVVVEEAAEVLEAHIITTLTNQCQHLILIGDHQQLRPNPTVYRLAKQFNLDTSLFERMINNGMPCRSLTHQHRMRPEISNLMKKHFYRNLSDDESVLKMDNVKGVAHDMFFLDHQHFESKSDDNKTKSNQYEAEFLVAFCKYLLQQGYGHSQITILTAYTGQLFCIRRLMDKATFEGVRVCVVDNFQGEENDIILLSLVRSNVEGSIGFLRTSNRVCVALSRARIGFYCIGNGSILKKAQIWQDILATLEADNLVGASLPVVCQNHPNKSTHIASKEDFKEKVPLGGCDVACESRLRCGHVCTLLCHSLDIDHKEYKCKKPCVRTCDRQHPCLLECYKECKCCVKLTKTFSDCDHVIQALCHKFDSVTCPKPCPRLCHDGQHQCRKLCGESCLEKCPERCERPMPCGHSCINACGDPCPDYCKVRVKRTLSRCGHTVGMDCSEQPDEYECHVKVWRDLPNCSHRTEMLCHEDPETIQCLKKCEEVLDCGHPCEECCWESCSTYCMVEVERTLAKCGHTVCMKCGTTPDENRSYEDPYVCKERCEKMLGCGHRCPNICGMSCKQSESKFRFYYGSDRNFKTCDEPVEKTYEDCGHSVTVPCHKGISKSYELEDSYVCKERCEKMLGCGHRCPNICGMSCKQSESKFRFLYGSFNRNFKTCVEPVERTYEDCGHSVTVPCHKDISKLPCSNRCEKMLSCGHSCPRKCSQKCPPENGDDQIIFERYLISPLKTRDYLLTRCQESCEKELLCSHKCPNKCGEPCPPANLKVTNTGRHRRFTKQEDYLFTECQEKVKKRLPDCDHYVSVRCSVDVSSFICINKCEKVLPCGHHCPKKCSEVCPKGQMDEKTLLKCVLEYPRAVKAYLLSVCQEKCQRELACGHKCPNKCGEPCPQATDSGDVRRFPTGIKGECQEKLNKKLPGCDHYVNVRCSKDVSSFMCVEKCEKVLPCGHRCPNKCPEPCPGDRNFKSRTTRGSRNYRQRTGPQERCEVVVKKVLTCGHKTKPVPCWKAESAAYATCIFPCDAVLQCGHKCTGNCNSCKQGTRHKLCHKVCNRQLLCGHKCPDSCGSCCSPDCRRCIDDLRHGSGKELTTPSPCRHNVTHRYLKTKACFRPCNQKLKCKHPCIGVCGEPCPSFCNVCDKKSVRINLPKGQFHPRDLYIYLPDCKHLCQMRSLDRTFAAVKNTLEKGCLQIRYVLCPKCKEPIRQCSRYDDILKIIRESINTARTICTRSITSHKNDGAAAHLPFTAGKWMRCRGGHLFYQEEEGVRVGERQKPMSCPECLKQKSS